MSKSTINIKLFLGILGAVVVIAVLISLNAGGEERGGNFTMTIPGQEQQGDANIKGVTLFVDFSGSMRGYVDGKNTKNPSAFDSFNASMISNVANGLTNIAYSYNISPQSICGKNKYDNKSFLSAMDNHSIFNKGTTLLDEMFAHCISSVSDSTVGILVTDMVLSYGRQKLLDEKNPSYNKHHLSDLSGKIYESLMEAYSNKKMHIVVLQYMSDYNGHYYCNYTENIVPNKYDKLLMKDRPFYVVLCGTENNLRSIMAKNCFRSYENVYASFLLPEPDRQLFEIRTAHPHIWFVGGDTVDGKGQGKGVVWAESEDDDRQEDLTIRCNAFQIPSYVKVNPNLEYNRDVFSSVTGPVNYNYTENAVLTFNAKLQPYGQLKKDMNAVITLYTDGGWLDTASTDNDAIDDAVPLQGKTWGFAALADQINKVYDVPTKHELARIEFIVSSK